MSGRAETAMSVRSAVGDWAEPVRPPSRARAPKRAAVRFDMVPPPVAPVYRDRYTASASNFPSTERGYEQRISVVVLDSGHGFHHRLRCHSHGAGEADQAAEGLSGTHAGEHQDRGSRRAGWAGDGQHYRCPGPGLGKLRGNL